MPFLADVNFLVALFHERHEKTGAAITWLQGQMAPDSIGICRVTQMGVLRILTNPAWLKDDVLTAGAVWRAWDRLLADERFAQVEEPPRLEAEWRAMTETFPAGRCAETDTYLAAFARAGGYQVLTFDRGFSRIEGVEALVLD